LKVRADRKPNLLTQKYNVFTTRNSDIDLQNVQKIQKYVLCCTARDNKRVQYLNLVGFVVFVELRKVRRLLD